MAGQGNGRATRADRAAVIGIGATFPPSCRLRQSTEFGRVFRDSRRSQDRYFTVLGRRNDRTGARLGLAISKKACKSAVGRNRLKRIIRESFRTARLGLPDIDLVVLARPAAAGASASDLTDSLNKHWQEITNRCAR